MRRASAALVVLAALLSLAAAAAGVLVYKKGEEQLAPAYRAFQPTRCGGHEYLVDPTRVAVLYTGEATAYYSDGMVMKQELQPHIAFVAEADCRNGTFYVYAGLGYIPMSIREDPLVYPNLAPRDSLERASEGVAAASGGGGLWTSLIMVGKSSSDPYFGYFNYTDVSKFDPATGMRIERTQLLANPNPQAGGPLYIVLDSRASSIAVLTTNLSQAAGAGGNGSVEALDVAGLINKGVAASLAGGALLAVGLLGLLGAGLAALEED